MYIIDKNKDFYDYLSYIYGVDKHVTFDRRGSTLISDENIVNVADIKSYYKKGFCILEIGNIQYLIKIFNIKIKHVEVELDIFVSCKMKIMYTFKNNVHYYKSPISIRGVEVKWIYDWKRKNGSFMKHILSDNYKDTITKVFENNIELPILAGTQLTKILNKDVIWKELQNYLSSLKNDENKSTKLTDVEKAVNHGFDKKTSFRHPIK